MKLRSILSTLALAVLLPFVAPVVGPHAIAQAPAAAAAKPAAAKPSAQVDINTATPAQLMAIPGIGDVYSKKIVAGRPYANKAQLLSRGILPKATYEKVQGMVIAKQPAK